MKFAFYLQNGIKVYALPDGYNKFYITENLETSSELSRYHYPGDDIQYSLDAYVWICMMHFKMQFFPLKMSFTQIMAYSRNGFAEQAWTPILICQKMIQPCVSPHPFRKEWLNSVPTMIRS